MSHGSRRWDRRRWQRGRYLSIRYPSYPKPSKKARKKQERSPVQMSSTTTSEEFSTLPFLDDFTTKSGICRIIYMEDYITEGTATGSRPILNTSESTSRPESGTESTHTVVLNPRSNFTNMTEEAPTDFSWVISFENTSNVALNETADNGTEANTAMPTLLFIINFNDNETSVATTNGTNNSSIPLEPTTAQQSTTDAELCELWTATASPINEATSISSTGLIPLTSYVTTRVFFQTTQSAEEMPRPIAPFLPSSIPRAAATTVASLSITTSSTTPEKPSNMHTTRKPFRFLTTKKSHKKKPFRPYRTTGKFRKKLTTPQLKAYPTKGAMTTQKITRHKTLGMKTTQMPRYKWHTRKKTTAYKRYTTKRTATKPPKRTTLKINMTTKSRRRMFSSTNSFKKVRPTKMMTLSTPRSRRSKNKKSKSTGVKTTSQPIKSTPESKHYPGKAGRSFKDLWLLFIPLYVLQRDNLF